MAMMSYQHVRKRLGYEGWFAFSVSPLWRSHRPNLRYICTVFSEQSFSFCSPANSCSIPGPWKWTRSLFSPCLRWRRCDLKSPLLTTSRPRRCVLHTLVAMACSWAGIRPVNWTLPLCTMARIRGSSVTLHHQMCLWHIRHRPRSTIMSRSRVSSRTLSTTTIRNIARLKSPTLSGPVEQLATTRRLSPLSLSTSERWARMV